MPIYLYGFAQSLFSLVCLTYGSAFAADRSPISPIELTEVSEPAQISISPSRKLVSFMVATPSVELDETRVEVVVVELDTERIVQRVANGSLIRSWNNWLEVEPPAWSSDSRYVYVRALENDEIQVWRIDVVGGERIKITSDAADVEKISVGGDGKTVTYWVRDSRQEARRKEELAAREGYLADDSLMLYAGLQQNYWLEGRRVTMTLQPGALVDIGHSSLRRKELNLDTGVVRETSAVVDTAPLPVWKTRDVKAFDDSGRGQVAVVRELPNERGQFDVGRLQVVRASDGRVVSECTAKECTGAVMQGARWAADGRRIVFIKNNASGSARIIAEWDPVSGRVRRVTSLNGILEGTQPYRLTGREGDCPIAGNSLVCVYEDSIIAPEVIRIDLADGHVRTLFNANPTLTADRFGRVETQAWQDELGNHLFTKLVFPPAYRAGERYPLVISTYLCKGFLRGGSGSEFPEFLFSAAGMLSMCVHYNGGQLPQYAKSSSDLAQVPPLERARALYERIVRELDGRGLIDVSKLGIGGLSWGSKLVEWELFHSGGFAAASIAAPALPDPIWADWMSPHRWEEVRSMYDLPASDDWTDPAWKAISPAINVTKIKTPLMINAEENEVRPGIQLYAALRRAKVPLDLYVYPEEGHQIFAFPSHRAIIYQRNVDWFRFWLQNFEDPSPVKAEQYARWRKMRGGATREE